MLHRSTRRCVWRHRSLGAAIVLTALASARAASATLTHETVSGHAVERVTLKGPSGAPSEVAWHELSSPKAPGLYTIRFRAQGAAVLVPHCNGRERVSVDGAERSGAPEAVGGFGGRKPPKDVDGAERSGAPEEPPKDVEGADGADGRATSSPRSWSETSSVSLATGGESNGGGDIAGFARPSSGVAVELFGSHPPAPTSTTIALAETAAANRDEGRRCFMI